MHSVQDGLALLSPIIGQLQTLCFQPSRVGCDAARRLCSQHVAGNLLRPAGCGGSCNSEIHFGWATSMGKSSTNAAMRDFPLPCVDYQGPGVNSHGPVGWRWRERDINSHTHTQRNCFPQTHPEEGLEPPNLSQAAYHFTSFRTQRWTNPKQLC